MRGRAFPLAGVKRLLLAVGMGALALATFAQSIQIPWGGFAHTPQHACVSQTRSQPLSRILWAKAIGSGGGNHYASPLITRSNTVIFALGTVHPQVMAVASETGQSNWWKPTESTLPEGAVFPMALTPKNRLCFAGGGGTVYYCDSPDSTAPSFSRSAFYGLSEYLADTNVFNTNVFICTPITADRYGDIFFGFVSGGSSPLGTQGGLARIDFDGSGSWISVLNATASTNLSQPAYACAPSLSSDEKTLYMAFTTALGYPMSLVALDSRTLQPLASVNLLDPQTKNPANRKISTASPTIGPDGDVYFGILGSNPGDNDARGWLLHFDRALSVSKTPGLFGWDVTASIVDASLVPSYHGNSGYLLAMKYNDYITWENKMALLDPQQGAFDAKSGVVVMRAVMTILSPNAKSPGGELFEWCINSAAVDPFSKSILVNNEDGNLYRWDLTLNQLTESIALTTTTTGQAYTPSVVGVDGVVYAINHGVLFAVGR